MSEPKENTSPQPKKPPDVKAIMAGVFGDMEDRKNKTKRMAASTRQERNIWKAEKRPFSEKDKTDDITQNKKQTIMKVRSSKRMKSRLTTRGQLNLTGQLPDDPKKIETE